MGFLSSITGGVSHIFGGGVHHVRMRDKPSGRIYGHPSPPTPAIDTLPISARRKVLAKENGNGNQNMLLYGGLGLVSLYLLTR